MATKYKQQADGRWRAKVWDGTYTDTGKKHYIFLASTKSSKDLEKLVSDYEIKRDTGRVVVKQGITFKEYARQWRETEKGLSESATKEMYDRVIDVYLKPLYSFTFDYLTRQAIQMVINNNSKHPRTCQQIHLTIKQICKSAEKDRLLPYGKTIELFDSIQLPKYKADEKKPLTDEQCSVVYNALVSNEMPPRSSLYLALIYFCGLRREEALAVKYEDVHSLSVTVNKALHMTDNETEVKGTKSARGERTVPFPADAIPIIQKALAEIEPNSQGFLFATKAGVLITKSSYRKMWDGIRKELGFDCSAHIFRHTYCTKLCYEAFENRTITVKQIARLLGDTEKMVSEVYGHIVEEKEQTAEALRSVFGKSSGNHLATNDSDKGYKMV